MTRFVSVTSECFLVCCCVREGLLSEGPSFWSICKLAELRTG